jgi:6-pyruvoyltetrahydropterin/6-carboxytetrahydropterin synthase
VEDQIVFVIDDDPDVRGALSKLFDSGGLRVEVFASAAELLQRELPDLPSCFVLDVRLQRSRGRDLHSELRRAGIKTPVVFIAGHGDIHMSVQAMKAGAVDLLAKPFRDQEMLDAVSGAIERDRKRRREEIHGHSFRAEVNLRGTPDPVTGMVVDLGLLQPAIEDVRLTLDHKFVNKIEALATPTLENLSRFVWERLAHLGGLTRVSIHRDSCNESCTFHGPQADGS